jgi:hypothetical protein
VSLHGCKFLLGELAFLQKDDVADADLADIMHGRGQANVAAASGIQLVGLRDRF